MWQRNNGQTEAEKLQNRFTAYLLVAVRRQQRDYVIKKNQRIRHEPVSYTHLIWKYVRI